jgi:dolichol-phosphate mannosyltransferase
MKLSIVLPCRNEVGNISQIVNSIRVNGWIESNSEVIVINDGSTDGTTELLSILEKRYSNLKVINTSSRLGLGKSIYLGITESKNENIAVLDTDGIHDPAYLALMLKENLNGFNLVIGSRYTSGGIMVGALYPHLSKMMNKLIKVITNSNVQDQLCGYFIANKKDLLLLQENDFIGFGEYFIRLIHFFENNSVVKEIPTTHRVRMGGERKSNRREMTRAYIKTAMNVRRGV